MGGATNLSQVSKLLAANITSLTVTDALIKCRRPTAPDAWHPSRVRVAAVPGGADGRCGIRRESIATRW